MTRNNAFKAIASEPRRRILNHLAGGPMTVGEIGAKFDMALPSISKHLSVLKEAGLVHEQKRGQFVIYSIAADNLINALYGFLTPFCPDARLLPAEDALALDAARAPKPKGGASPDRFSSASRSRWVRRGVPSSRPFLPVARPRPRPLRDALELDDIALKDALAWLADYRLVERDRTGAWRTDSDPWELMMRALEQRRQREIAPALDLLRDCQRAALAEGGRDRAVASQIGKLLALAEDLAAIDMQARRLSPRALRQMIGIGGRAARFMDRTFGRRDR
jgi:DNA-binding transcriptional ArsR family regulator